jgi:PilZ domain
MQERDSVRSRAFLKAHILIQNLPSMECVVRNISLSGARLEVDKTFALPIEFELEIPQLGVVLWCELKWRRDDTDTVGVNMENPACGASLVVRSFQQQAFSNAQDLAPPRKSAGLFVCDE